MAVCPGLGKVFLSYRRSRVDEIRLLNRALRDRGVPTWQDILDIGAEGTEQQIRRVLEDPATSGAVLWLTPEVAQSSFIARVEAQAVFDRARQDQDFIVVVVAGQDVDIQQAGQLFHDRLLRDWISARHTESIGATLDEAEAARIARCVLRERLQKVHRNLPGADDPLPVEIYARAAAPQVPRAAMVFDWHERFRANAPYHRHAEPGVWSDHLLPALREAFGVAQQIVPDRPAAASGVPTISAATALGWAFAGAEPYARLWWEQRDRDRPGSSEIWSLEIPPEKTGYQIEQLPGDTGACDLAVLLDVVQPTQEAFNRTPDLPSYRATLRCYHPDWVPKRKIRAGQACGIAHQTIEAIVQARHHYKATGSVHLFMAVPVGLALMIGQSLNTIGHVKLYELNESTHTYQHEVTLG